MAKVSSDAYRCPKCGEVKVLDATNFYFDAVGRVNSFCKICHAAYDRAKAEDRAADPYLQAAYRRYHREYMRARYRRLHAVPPERYRVGT